ncbi:MAG: hypothetical protein ACC656_15830 [Candidatus Heimdallarchaeota archaeon]
MQEKIFPNVEYMKELDIPSKPFFRKTQKFYMKTNEEGNKFLGKTYLWTEIKSVSIQFFNNNPYIQLNISGNTKHSFFFESNFFYRKKAPWFGGSEFMTKEFVNLLEEKGLFTLKQLEKQLEGNSEISQIHKIWNTFFWVFPPILLLISLVILYLGITAT